MSFALGYMLGTSSCASENIELRKCEVLSAKAQTLVCYQKYEQVQAKNAVLMKNQDAIKSLKIYLTKNKR